ncbi:MAG: hypothetical protein V1910_00985 [bacterium]
MKNNIITIIIIVIIGMMAFWYLTKTENVTDSLVKDIKTTDSVDAKYIYTILQKMAQVTLDDSIFADAIFKKLKDNTVFFPPQSAGRDNPFAPIDINISKQTISTTTVKQ